MILKVKNTGLLRKLYEHGDVHVMKITFEYKIYERSRRAV